MKFTAIVAEYNPFTAGHAYHLKKVREETGADAVVALMSGSFTQRGDAAIADKYLRAETACRCGIDLVLELPLVYSLSSAEHFAMGAIKTLSAVKEIDCLSFGSECGDVSLIEKAAELSINEPPELSAAIKTRLDCGTAYPRAYAEAVAEFSENREDYRGIAELYGGANNVLAVAYVSAAKKIGWKVKFHTVKRVGANYGNTDARSEYPSAAAVRAAAFEKRIREIENAVPKASYEILSAYRGSPDALGDMILYKMKRTDAIDLLEIRGFDAKDGICNRLKTAAETSSSYAEYLSSAKSKNYTMARIKRLSLCALFDVTQKLFETASELPPYFNVLAVRKERSAEILSALSYLPNFFTKFSDAAKKADPRLLPLTELDAKAQDILSVVNRAARREKVMSVVE